jgi:hypothetical protein
MPPPPISSRGCQFNFQHSELQGKKEKLTRLEDKRHREASGRHHSVSAARDLLRRLREESARDAEAPAGPRAAAPRGGHAPSPDARRRRLAQATDGDGGAALCRSLPELLALRRAGAAEGTRRAERRNAALRRIVAGYQNALGAGATEFPPQGGFEQAVLQQ